MQHNKYMHFTHQFPTHMFNLHLSRYFVFENQLSTRFAYMISIISLIHIPNSLISYFVYINQEFTISIFTYTNSNIVSYSHQLSLSSIHVNFNHSQNIFHQLFHIYQMNVNMPVSFINSYSLKFSP